MINRISSNLINQVKQYAQWYESDCVEFLRDIIAIRSLSGQEEEVIQRIRAEMEKVGFDEVSIDPMGNVLGKIGGGKRIVAMDAHVDTVDVGDPELWQVDPFRGALKDRLVYGRGACDMKGSMASLVYAGKTIKVLGLEDDYTLYVTGTVQEEDCDGLCWQYIINENKLVPEVVLIGEPTNLGIYRGQRGRMEMEVRTKGLSCHGSAPERGINAIYRMAPIVLDIEHLNNRLTGEEFLGKGSITISEIRSTSPSLCAVADSATIHLDRRLAKGDTIEVAVNQIKDLPSVQEAGAEVLVLDYAVRSYRGVVYPTKKFYPTWVTEEKHAAVQSGLQTYELLFDESPVVGRWSFSTNGVATMGMHKIPTLGFGPGNEIYAHTSNDQIPIEHLVRAMMFYAVFPQMYVWHVQNE
jgi:putative selenium metabolism hydrolase